MLLLPHPLLMLMFPLPIFSLCTYFLCAHTHTTAINRCQFANLSVCLLGGRFGAIVRAAVVCSNLLSASFFCFSCRTFHLLSVMFSLNLILFFLIFFFAVIQQPYSVQVYGEYAIAGNTGHMKCQIPAFVRDYVKVTAWLKGDAIVATSLSPKGMLFCFLFF